MKNTQYSATSRLFHWGMALLILLTIPAGKVMVEPGISRGLQNALFLYHKNVGVLLLILVVGRLVWRWRNPAPKLPESLSPLQAKVALLTHGLLYALLVAVPVAGYIRVRAGGFPIESLDALELPTLVAKSEGLAEAAKSVHDISGSVLIVLLAMHIGAALFHRFVRRDGVFERMWPPFGGAGRS
ncbi:MAG: cytochrome b [Gemmobacter sp.]|nr:cytochrome b [Gemmobacter sp.]